jgi:hypothetical protein
VIFVFNNRGSGLGALACALAAAITLGACSSGDTASGDAGACFTALDPQFDGFRSWTSYSFQGSAAGDPSSFVFAHLAGPRTEYINTPPPHGSTAFPTGTIIVKEIGAGDPANHHLFTMVKRGCDFNAAGATNWEWMELTETAGGGTVLWRGAQPPAGESYAADGESCNTCHKSCATNDSVCSPKITLASD